ncbi:MAG: membrane protein insertase YidC [Saprospiraceae bacterium]|uniref:Membrane protein insertase YidC n=1 Tax=Candidatus Opimibacter skivensis TaxID=2982028 RepID=A0A9D7XQI4_9BACT|nr:membrane protein insertase YidC [Candidatus Opimibacter skivensis]
MERNHIIGFVLIFALLMVWTFVNSPSKVEMEKIKQTQDSLHRAETIKDSVQTKKIDSISTATLVDSAQIASKFGSFATAALGTDKTVRLENELFKVDFLSKGGKISSVELKKYNKALLDDKKKEYKIPLHLLEDPKDIWDIAIPTQRGDLHTADLHFIPTVDNNKVTFTATGQQGERIIQEYSLTGNPYEIKYRFSIENGESLIANSGQTAKLTWINQLDKLERNSTFERSYSTVYYKVNTESVDYCSCRKNDVNDLSAQPIKWISHSNQFFNTALIADESFSGGVFSTTMLPDSNENLKITSSIVGIPFNGSNPSTTMTMYIGPNDFDQLRHYNVNLEDVIPFGRSIFGTINRWIIRPTFNFLLLFIPSKGLVILFLTLLVKLALFPLSYKMLGSQAKMTALKPKLAHLKEKHKDDMQQQQVESMKIYREYGVNPLGGCFPVVLQMPVWFALYRFFPASIEFRQAKFLWATDLSSFDVFTYLPFNIPFYGDHVSMLTLLWALSTIAYTYYNMQNVDMANSNPALKYMQYLMPVMFLVFFNSYASGLTLYLLYSNTLNIIQTVGARKYLFDTDKIMEKLNVNKAKPKKEGGFQSRIEQAMKEQQRLAAAKNTKPNKKN